MKHLLLLRMSGKSSKESSLDKVKDEIYAVLCTVKGSVSSERLLSNIFPC